MLHLLDVDLLVGGEARALTLMPLTIWVDDGCWRLLALHSLPTTRT